MMLYELDTGTTTLKKEKFATEVPTGDSFLFALFCIMYRVAQKKRLTVNKMTHAEWRVSES